MGSYYDWDEMAYKPLPKRANQRCEYRQKLLECLYAEQRNGDLVTKMYAGLLADALTTMSNRHKKQAA